MTFTLADYFRHAKTYRVATTVSGVVTATLNDDMMLPREKRIGV